MDYVPVVNGKHQKTPMFGDGLFDQRGGNISYDVSREEDPIKRLDGLVPCIQEFHKKKVKT